MKLNIDLTQNSSKNVYFISDFHLFHNNVLRFDNRPFKDVYEMHEVLKKNWNDIVTNDDIVIYLGDLSFARSSERKAVEDFVKTLNGEIHFILGNHDRYEDIKKLNRFKSVESYLEVNITHLKDGAVTKTLFCCMHYPIYSWNKSHHGSYMIHGHCHGNLHHGEDANFYINRRVIDVGCMLQDYKPISFNEILNKLSHVQIKKFSDREV